MKKIGNKIIKFFINLLFILVWFIICALIWEYIADHLEYENIYLYSFWVSAFPPYKAITTKSFLLIFLIPSYLFSKYIWFNKR